MSAVVFSLFTSCVSVKVSKSGNFVGSSTPSSENTVLFKGKPVHTYGFLPKIGSTAPDFTATDKNLQDKKLSDFSGKNIILNIFPSVDTKVCSASVRHFNQDAAALDNTVILCISKDLPFAQERFCGAEGIKNVVMLSDFRTQFGKIYGVELTDGPLEGLLSRAVVVISPEGKIVYEEQVSDIAHEPNYDAALSVIKSRN